MLSKDHSSYTLRLEDNLRVGDSAYDSWFCRQEDVGFMQVTPEILKRLLFQNQKPDRAFVAF